MKKFLFAAVCFLLCLCVNLYYRSFPVFFPQLKDDAVRAVDRQTQQKVAANLNQQNPGLSNLGKAKLFPQALAEYKKTNSRSIRQQIRQEFDRLRDPFQDKTGQTYLMELDCWHWARYVENIQRLGRIGDEVKNGRQWDTLMNFPEGAQIPSDTLFYYLSFFLFKIVSFLHPVGLNTFLFYLPLFFTAVFLGVLYAFCARTWGNVTACIACLFAGLSAIFIPRSCAGWFDRDVLNLLFPLLIVWAYASAEREGQSARRTRVLGCLAGLLLGLFAFTWVGWPFIIGIIVLFEAVYFANLAAEAVQYKADVRAQAARHGAVLALCLGTGLAWIALFCGTGTLVELYGRIRQAMVLNKAVTWSIWPNVFSTVGELKRVDYTGIARSVGGLFLFLVSLFSMLAVFLNLKSYRPMQRDLAVMFVVWFMVMFFFSSRGVRFTMFLGIPLGIFLGWSIELAHQSLSRLPKRLFTMPLLGLFVAAMILISVANAERTAAGCLPLMDDNLYHALTTIRTHTPEGAVINSWWDYGDWFKAVARRPVIFDGQTQDSPRAYWMARAILADSEEEALAVLRMLNNGGMRAFELIQRQLKDPFESVAFLQSLLRMSAAEGAAALHARLPAAAQEVSDLLYAAPKHKAYFIVDSSMTGKVPAISFLGTWDFSKVYLSKALRSQPRERIVQQLSSFGLDERGVAQLYEEAEMVRPGGFDSWVSQRYFIYAVSVQDKTQEDVVLFGNGFVYNPLRRTFYSYSPAERRYRTPQSLFLKEDGSLREIAYEKPDLNYSALLLENDSAYTLITLSRPLARSMFVRLYFLDGEGLRHFRLFAEEKGSEASTIKVFEVLWEL